MTHLTPEQLERFATLPTNSVATPEARHLEACQRCRDEVVALRAVIGALRKLPARAPRAGFPDAVLARIELPDPWLDRQLEGLPRLAPSPELAGHVVARIRLPGAELDRRLASLPHHAPAAGFDRAVLARVRLPVPWYAKAGRLVRTHRAAVAGTAASLAVTVGAAAAWLFGLRGLSPGGALGLAAEGLAGLATRGLIALGRLGYEIGLVDATGAITARLNPTAALGAVALMSSFGLLSLWGMTRMLRAEPQPLRFEKAA